MSLSAYNAARVDAPCVEPVKLLTIAFDGLTVYLGDRVFGCGADFCKFDGRVYEPLVLSWEAIEHGRIDPVDYSLEPSSAGFTLDNSVPVGGAANITALFSVYDPHYATVTISRIYLFNGQVPGAGDRVDLFAGKIEDLPGMSREQVGVTCTGLELDIANRFPVAICTTDEYPGADPDDVGKMLPVVYGRPKRVPALAVDAGSKTTIVSGWSATTPGNGGTAEITDGSLYPAGAFTLQIDSEQIAIASRSGDVLTLADSGARGFNATIAAAHDAGAACAEVQSEYVYVVAGHPVNAVDAVYVDGIRQTGNFTAYTGRAGDEKAGYEGRAVIVFAALPIFVKQVNVQIEDTIDVNDSIGVSQGSHGHPASEETVTWNFETSAKTSGTVYNPMSCVDGDFETMSGFDYSGSEVRLEKAYYESYSANPTQIRLCMATGAIGSGVTMQFRFCGRTLNVTASNAVTKGSWQSLGSSYNTWAEINAADGYVEQLGSNNSSYVKEVWAEFRYTPAVTASPATGVAKTGAAIKVGTVTITGNSSAEVVIGRLIAADLQGCQDDSVGTITGTPGALIERPDHLLRHLLTVLCGLPASACGSPSYADAGAWYGANDFTLALAILEKPNVRVLVNDIARQSRSIEFWSAGVHHIKPITVSETTDHQLSAHRIDHGNLWLSFTDRALIENSFSAVFRMDWSGHTEDIEASRAVVTARHGTSIDRYGVLTGSRRSFPYIQDAAQAQLVLDWIKDDLNSPRLLIDLAGGYFLEDFERGQVFAFDFMAGDLLDKALLGLFPAADRFRIINKIDRPDGALQIQAVALSYQARRKDIAGAYDILAIRMLEGIYDIRFGREISGTYDILAQTVLAGQYDIAAGKSLAGSCDILIQKRFTGAYDIGVQKMVSGSYDILACRAMVTSYDIAFGRQLAGIFDILAKAAIVGRYRITGQAKLLDGTYDIHARQPVSCAYDILARRTVTGGNDILIQQVVAGSNDILARRAVAGSYDIMVGPPTPVWASQTTPDMGLYTIGWSPDLGLFAACGQVLSDSGGVMTSSDGISWTQRDGAGSSSLYRAIACSPSLGLFAAVGGNAVMTSPDGINWTARTPTSAQNWFGIDWSPTLGLFVAVSASGTSTSVMTSTNGVNWTQRTAFSNRWNDVVWSPSLGLFAAVAYTGTGQRAMTSPDGINWTLRNTPADYLWSGLAWSPDLGLFAAVARSGTGDRVMTSPDGIVWSIRDTPADQSWFKIAWSSHFGVFAAVSYSGTGQRVMTSSDGETWELQNTPTDYFWRDIACSPSLEMFAACCSDGTTQAIMIGS